MYLNDLIKKTNETLNFTRIAILLTIQKHVYMIKNRKYNLH